MMTRARLEALRGLRAEIRMIQREIEELYTPITCPNGREVLGAPGTRDSDPTADAVGRILTLQGRLQERQEELAEELEAIEAWIDGLDDVEARAIIRAHYLLGDSWAVCTQRLMPWSMGLDSAKTKIYRLLEKS